MRNLFSGWLPQPSPAANRRRAARKHRPARRLLRLEPLEDRALMAVVSWWTADNITADSVGTNDGSLARGAAYAAGQVNQAFSFDGIDDSFQAPTGGLPSGSADRTVELWARIDQQVAEEAFFAG
ncbi:MAG: hypothetical protein FJ297_10850 [Planctomycetes bacterium]|nr:hypothetical protein [Planctomycetota bacterium]